MEKILRSRIREIAKSIKSYNKGFELDVFFDAVEFSIEAHKGQKRVSGEEYIWHPIEVVAILAQYEADQTTIISAILHDTVEDTQITIEIIKEKFGTIIADVVSGVTNLGRINFTSAEEHKIENFRRMFMAMAKDIRVIIIKLADRLHNMRTLKYLDNQRQQKIAKETMDIYAPLAHRIGMSSIKWELEDLCFRVLYEEDYQKLKKDISEKRQEREKYIDDFVKDIDELLRQHHISPEVTGRPKHFWSIYNKMRRQHTSIKNLYDLYAIRIIVNTVKQCYTVLGILHTEYKPIPGRFKDYIAMPKQNMYQSLHTVVIADEGKPVEVQIRTRDMHKVSEFGIAAHWRYKEGSKEDNFEKKLSWLRELIEWQKEVDDKDFYEDLKIDLIMGEIFVFTPKGDVFELPPKATALDFAYRIHTEIGHRCIGVKVNNKIVNLDSSLKNGDIVEIITSNIAQPKFAWISMVKTSSAKSKIKQWFKKNTEIFSDEKDKTEKKICSQDLVKKDITEINPCIKGKSRKSASGVIVEGSGDVMTYISRCCNAMPGDEILGYITKGRGVAVHRKDCRNIKQVDQNRLIRVEWDNDYTGCFEVSLEIESNDRIGLFNDIVAKITEQKLNIVNGALRTTNDGRAIISLILNLTNISKLDTIMNKIKSIPDVIKVRRKGEF